jgi:hypothetical protein
MMRALGILFFLAILLWLYAMSYAQAQEHHERHHAYYQGWMNKAHFGCCNDQDCGELADENERTTADGTIEVKIEGEWCPVLPHHYLKQGNAPDWSTSHVCVQKGPVPRVCERLLCCAISRSRVGT